MSKIWETGVQLGYFHKDDIKGCCNGFTLKWLNACLIGEEAQFNQRVKQIINDKALVERIQSIKDKVKSGCATQEEKDTLDILAFYEGMSLFQNPDNHSELFGTELQQGDYELISELASSDSMSQLGGLAQLYTHTGIYTAEELEDYLNQLALMFDSMGTDAPTFIGFRLTNYNHAVGLCYHRARHEWTFKNITFPEYDPLTNREISKAILYGFNELPPMIKIAMDKLQAAYNQKSEEEKANCASMIGTLAIKECRFKIEYLPQQTNPWRINESSELTEEEAINQMYSALNAGKSPLRPEAMNLSVISTKQNEELFQLKSQLEKKWASYIQPLVITDEIAQSELGEHLAIQAITSQNAQLIDDLLCHEINPNQKLAGYYSPLAIFSSKMGWIEVLDSLARHQADLEIGDDTPLITAAEWKQHEAIKWLLQHKVNIDAKNSYGATAMHIAAQSGDMESIKILMSSGATLDVETKNGSTPIHLAALEGHSELVDFLLQHTLMPAITFSGTAEIFRGIAQSKSPRAVSRLNEIIQGKLEKGMSEERVTFSAQEMTFIMSKKVASVQYKEALLTEKNKQAPLISDSPTL